MESFKSVTKGERKEVTIKGRRRGAGYSDEQHAGDKKGNGRRLRCAGFPSSSSAGVQSAPSLCCGCHPGRRRLLLL